MVMVKADRQNPPRRQYAPVNRCIYCGRTGDLTDEHILALSLGGREILPKASCRSCAEVTGDIEQHLAGHILKPARTKYRMKSRRKHPLLLPITYTDATGNERTQNVAIEDHPGSFVLIKMKPPAILDGRTPSRMIQGRPWIHVPDVAAHNRLVEDKQSLGLPAFKLETFNRVLAKTAYAYAVALGLDKFQPLVIGLILDGSEISEYVVGGEIEDLPAEEMLHKLQITTPLWHEGRCYVAVDIRLFAQFGGPRYRVVVGEQNGPVFQFDARPAPQRSEFYWTVRCRQCRKPIPALHDISRGKVDPFKDVIYWNIPCPECGAKCLYNSYEAGRLVLRLA